SPPPADLFTADLNNDSKLDLLVSRAGGNSFTVFLTKGKGVFPDGGSGTFLVGGSGSNRLVAAHFTGDGIADVIVQSCSSGGDTITGSFGNGDGTFVQSSGADDAFPPFASSCMDALGFITLAGQKLPNPIVSTLDQKITIFLNDGAGFFPRQQNVPGN